jgi:hypothetical protein
MIKFTQLDNWPLSWFRKSQYLVNGNFHIPINSKLNAPGILYQEILQAGLTVFAIANSEASVVKISATICRSDNTNRVLLVGSFIPRHRHCDSLFLQGSNKLLGLVAWHIYVVWYCRNNKRVIVPARIVSHLLRVNRFKHAASGFKVVKWYVHHTTCAALIAVPWFSFHAIAAVNQLLLWQV